MKNLPQHHLPRSARFLLINSFQSRLLWCWRLALAIGQHHSPAAGLEMGILRPVLSIISGLGKRFCPLIGDRSWKTNLWRFPRGSGDLFVTHPAEYQVTLLSADIGKVNARGLSQSVSSLPQDQTFGIKESCSRMFLWLFRIYPE